jgi:hypothetical protein
LFVSTFFSVWSCRSGFNDVDDDDDTTACQDVYDVNQYGFDQWVNYDSSENDEDVNVDNNDGSDDVNDDVNDDGDVYDDDDDDEGVNDDEEVVNDDDSACYVDQYDDHDDVGDNDGRHQPVNKASFGSWFR